LTVVPAASWMNRLRLTDGVLGLGDLLVDPAQGTAGPVVPVLVVDDLVPAFRGWPGGPGPGEDVPVRNLLAGVLAVPLRDDAGDVGDAHAQDERQSGGLDRLLAGLGDHPGIGHDGHVGQPAAGHELADDRQHGLVSYLESGPRVVAGLGGCAR
jgi:hypothetical protein